jgi:hypothetical protein
VEAVATSNSTARAGDCRTGGRGLGPRARRRRRSPVAVRSLAATLAVAALAAPVAAAATPSLTAQGVAAVQRENAFDEAHHVIPFKRGTKFTIACAVKGQDVLCREHAGPERCINGRPWILLTEEFPILGHKIGRTLLPFGLQQTDEYCR